MWRELNKTVPLAVSSSAALGNYSGSLVEGARLFNNRVSTDWAKDGFRDYLSSTRAEVFDGRATLQRLCAERAGGKASPFTERQSDAGRADVLQVRCSFLLFALFFSCSSILVCHPLPLLFFLLAR